MSAISKVNMEYLSGEITITNVDVEQVIHLLRTLVGLKTEETIDQVLDKRIEKVYDVTQKIITDVSNNLKPKLSEHALNLNYYKNVA